MQQLARYCELLEALLADAALSCSDWDNFKLTQYNKNRRAIMYGASEESKRRVRREGRDRAHPKVSVVSRDIIFGVIIITMLSFRWHPIVS